MPVMVYVCIYVREIVPKDGFHEAFALFPAYTGEGHQFPRGSFYTNGKINTA